MNSQARLLLLLRHAKSSWSSDTAADFDRPLTKRGKRDAPNVGLWLKHQGLLPDLVLSSPAKRARETVLKVCQELPFEKENIQWAQEFYEATLKNLITLLKSCPDTANTILMVGHNPGLEYLLEYLSTNSIALPENGKLLTTACVANLEVATRWNSVGESVARLISITRPADM